MGEEYIKKSVVFYIKRLKFVYATHIVHDIYLLQCILKISWSIY